MYGGSFGDGGVQAPATPTPVTPTPAPTETSEPVTEQVAGDYMSTYAGVGIGAFVVGTIVGLLGTAAVIMLIQWLNKPDVGSTTSRRTKNGAAKAYKDEETAPS